MSLFLNLFVLQMLYMGLDTSISEAKERDESKSTSGVVVKRAKRRRAYGSRATPPKAVVDTLPKPARPQDIRP